MRQILIISDDKSLAETLANKLTEKNYKVFIANNGAQGIQSAFEFNPDLILCEVNLFPIDGYQIYNVLKESSLLDQTPFMFISANADLRDVRLGLDLGADDYFVKPLDYHLIVQSIDKRLRKYQKLKEFGKREFKTLFRINPSGVLLLDETNIFDANPTIAGILGTEAESLISNSIQDIFEPDSFSLISDRIERCSKGLLNSFDESVCLRSFENQLIRAKLSVSAYEKYLGYSKMIAIISEFQSEDYEKEDNDFDAIDKKKMAESELAPDSGSEKHTHRKDNNVEVILDALFSKREVEVLNLSMEGLPMKLIADKLSISERTVEKHRANLMAKTNSKNIIEVIVFALKHNLVEV